MDKPRFLPRTALQTLLDALNRQGFRTLGPTVQDGAIQYLDLQSVDQLPHGMHDAQSPGSYRLNRHDTARCFAWANGPQALKPALFSSREVLWTSTRDAGGKLGFRAAQDKPPPLAVIGVRACDLAALGLQDRHFLDTVKDPYYAARRKELFLVAVNCTHAADTCFCSSTGDGPRATSGYDIVLSELDDGYLLDAGSERGRSFAAELPSRAASAAQLAQAERDIEAAARQQVRALPGRQLRDTLFARLKHPRWEQVAERCLSCGNCTGVCPTCFCHAESDSPALGGESTEHLREWDSCFSLGHSYLHGFVVRPETVQRYRQWLTHKLGSWHDQYGRSGCVGCGRCITWCPVGIDITAEANALCDANDGIGETQ